MTAPFVLIHSPLVGPVTWSWVARELQERGYGVVVPALVDAVMSGGWRACVEVAAAAAAAASEPAILVGHSGAGPLLPTIARRMQPPPVRLVFVDAGLPSDGADTALIPEEYLAMLRALARGGTLPAWSEWFGPDVMETLVPDAGRRRAVVADLPELPLAYFEIPIPTAMDRSAIDGAYILLSEAYRADAISAAALGWPVVEMLGGHLDIVTRPDVLADTLISLAER